MAHIHILLVEDSATQATVSRKDLESIGSSIEVQVSPTAAQALEQIKNSGANIDLVVLDLTLPDGSGLDVCRAIKGDPITRQVPVVIFSMQALSKYRQEAYSVGADHYISKGSTGDATLRLVATTLLRKKLRKLPRLGEALIASGYITIHQLQQALDAQDGGQSFLLGQWLVQKNIITQAQLQEVLDTQQRNER